MANSRLLFIHIIKILLIALCAALCCAPVSPAASKSCVKSNDSIDRMLCSDPEFQAVDQKMATTYFGLLRSITDREMREGLIASQQRWIRARQRGVPPSADQRDLFPEEPTRARRRAIIKATQDKILRLLQRTKDDKNNTMISEMERQRKQFPSFKGGPFQGFRTQCDFQKSLSDNDCFCTSAIIAQEGGHICVRSLEWASGHETYFSIVARVIGNDVEQQAICKEGYYSEYPSCPNPYMSSGIFKEHKPIVGEMDDKPIGWDRSRGTLLGYRYDPILKLDPDATFDGWAEYENLQFLNQCIKNPSFPPKSIRKFLRNSFTNQYNER